jgi:hypothetical protein
MKIWAYRKTFDLDLPLTLYDDYDEQYNFL